MTDNDNYIVDLYFTEPIKDANQAGKEVRPNHCVQCSGRVKMPFVASPKRKAIPFGNEARRGGWRGFRP